MATFPLFLLLPLEVRQCIWELSMEPRIVVVGPNPDFYWKYSRPPRARPPPVLHACYESWSHLQRYYTKGFTTGEAPGRYIWVNFEIDTIQVSQYYLEDFVTELPFIRKLIMEGYDSETFFYKWGYPLRHMAALEMVTILHLELMGEVDEDWWKDWDSQMDLYYYTDKPIYFYTKIVYLDCPPYEINPENYVKVERDDCRKRVAEDPEGWDGGYEVSDSDDDVRGPGRFRRWRHY